MPKPGRRRLTFHEKLRRDMLRPDPVSATIPLLGLHHRDSTPRHYLDALRHIVDAHGGPRPVARAAGFGHDTLQRALGPGGNPTLATLLALLRVLGLRLTLVPVLREPEGPVPRRSPASAGDAGSRALLA